MGKDVEDQIDDETLDDVQGDGAADADADADNAADDIAGDDDDAGADNDADDAAGDDGAGADDDKKVSGKAADGTGDSDKPSRKENRVAALARRVKDAEERAIRAEAIAEERNKSSIAPVDYAAAARAREEKLALMEPSERKEFIQGEKIEQMQSQVLLTQLKTEDMIDRQGYQTEARNNPVYAKHAGEVENRLRAERQQGRNWFRSQILAQIVGEAALQAKPNKKEKEQARERVNSVRGTPIKGRSNTSTYRPSRGNESFEDIERRLENVTF